MGTLAKMWYVSCGFTGPYSKSVIHSLDGLREAAIPESCPPHWQCGSSMGLPCKGHKYEEHWTLKFLALLYVYWFLGLIVRDESKSFPNSDCLPGSDSYCSWIRLLAHFKHGLILGWMWCLDQTGLFSSPSWRRHRRANCCCTFKGLALLPFLTVFLIHFQEKFIFFVFILLFWKRCTSIYYCYLQRG